MGGIVKSLELIPPDYRIPWDMVRKLITNRTRMIILNSPNNPTATVLQQNDIDELLSLVENRDILILSDEVTSILFLTGKPIKAWPVMKNCVSVALS